MMMLERQQRIQRAHWFFAHLADFLLIVLVAGFILYSLYAWGPM